MTEQPKVGQLLAGNEGRDAIHVAIAPVTAMQPLTAAEPIKVTPTGHAYRSNRREAIGIVDPFIEGTIETGQKFYVFMLPNTITSLRHVWTHPAFKTTPPEVNKK